MNRPSPKLLFLLIPALLSSAITSGSYLTAIPCLILILISYKIKFVFPKNSFNSTLACLGIFGLSLLIHLIIITNLPTGNGPHIMAASIIVLMVYLWYHENPKMTSNLIVLLSLMAIIFTGNNLDDSQSFYPTIIGLLIPSSLIYLLSGTKKAFSKLNITFITITVIFVSLSTLFFNKMLFFTDEKLSEILQNLNNSSYGNSDSTKTGISSQLDIESHVKLKLSNKPLIILKAKRASYLRTEVFVNYANKSWIPSQNEIKQPIRITNLEINQPNIEQFKSYDHNSINELKRENNLEKSSIQLLEKSASLPLPPSSRVFDGNNLKIKPYHIVEKTNSLNYYQFYDVKDDFYNYKLTRNDTDINNIIAGELSAKTIEITKSAKTNLKKAELLELYFHKNFIYSLNVDFEPTKDPIVDFIFTKKKGFCLHFASAMVLMLRSIGIPSHLVTGYIVSEYDKSFRANIIRERDSHAWVEVYENNNWVTYDPTPVGQMNTYVNSKPDLKDKMALYFKLFLAWISDFFNRLFSGFNLVTITKIGQSPYTILLGIILITFIIYRSYKARKIEDKIIINLDKETEILKNRINSILEKNNFKFDDNTTYQELIIFIESHENIDLERKKSLINLINIYQKYRYNNIKIKDDYDRLDLLIDSFSI